MRCIIFIAPSAVHIELSSHRESELKLARSVLLRQEKGTGVRTIERQGCQV